MEKLTPLSSAGSEELLLCSCGAEDPEEVIYIILHDFFWWKMFNDSYGLGMVNQLGKPIFVLLKFISKGGGSIV